MRSVSLVHYHNLNEKTKSNILNFLKKRIKETASSTPKGVQGKTASRQIRNENKSFNFFGWNFFFSKDIHNGI